MPGRRGGDGVTPTNGHAVNGYPANGYPTGHGAGPEDGGQGQEQYQAQEQYGGYQNAAQYSTGPADASYQGYRRPDPATNGYGIARAEGPATNGYGIARAAQGPATGSYPTMHYQSAGHGRQPAGEITSQGYQADPEATQLFPTALQGRRGGEAEPELDLDDSHPAVAPPPLRSRTQVQPAVRERAGWSAIGAPAAPGSTPPPRPKGPRLRVDWPNCKAHGLCHELLPEAVRLDEWGFPIVGNQPLPSHVIDDARRAVIACPTLALRLVD
jgi:ferredoxin